MAVDNKNVKEFEQKYKEELFRRLEKFYSQQHEIISRISELSQYVDLEGDLPDLGTTLNNKLVELQHEFQNVGISMYSHKVEDYGLFKLNFVESSFIGDAIIFDLMKYVSDGVQKLTDFSETFEKITEKIVGKKQALEKTNPVRRFFAKIRKFFVPIKQEYSIYTKEETETLNSHLLDYKEADNQLWKYNLRDNVISGIVRKIRERGDKAHNVPGILEECVYQDLKKLGLEDLIPQLQQALIGEYKKDLPDSETHKIKDEDLYLYVPDFDRKIEKTENVNIEELHSLLADGKKKLKEAVEQGGISLSDMSLIDKTSNASDRQAAASAIGEELHPVQEVNQGKKQGDSEIALDD